MLHSFQFKWGQLMDTKNIENIRAEDLIGLRAHLKEYLLKLDCHNREHRQLAIDTMELYIKRYISPTMYLPDTTIDGVMGTSVEGLALGVMFDSERKSMERPNEEEIKEVFRDFLGHEGTQQWRDDFWAAWLLRNAVGCVQKLCNFLKEPLIQPVKRQIEATVLEREIKQLQEIYKIPMTGIKSWIEILLEWEQEALAEWNEESSISS